MGFCDEVTLTDGSALTVSVNIDDWAEFPMESLIITYIESVPEDEKDVE